MQQPKHISAQLQSKTDQDYARKRSKQVQPLRGLRGVPAREIVPVLVDTWKASPLALPDEVGMVHQLFTTAFEDGLVAMGLAAAALPDAPLDVLDLADRWLEIVDDVETADTLGWLLYGPAILASQEPFVESLLPLLTHEHPMRRRVGALACFAAMPVPIEGPSAAALRERMGQRRLAFVEAPLDELLTATLPLLIRDEVPIVRRAVARGLRTWATFSPEPVEQALASTRGGVPRYVRDEAEKGIKKGRRRQR